MIGVTRPSQRRWVFDILSDGVFCFAFMRDGVPWLTDRYMMMEVPHLIRDEVIELLAGADGAPIRWPSTGKPKNLKPGELSAYTATAEQCNGIVDSSILPYMVPVIRTGETWESMDQPEGQGYTALLAPDGKKTIMRTPYVDLMPEAWEMLRRESAPARMNLRLQPIIVRSDGHLIGVFMPFGYRKAVQVEQCKHCEGRGVNRVDG